MKKLADEELLVMEMEFANGGSDNVKEYFEDAVENRLQDQDELRRRMKVLGRSPETIALQCYALFSVLIGDRKGWDRAAEMRGSEMDPGLGYLAYQYRTYYFSEDGLDSWLFLLQHARQQGHIPAASMYWSLRAKKFGLMGTVLIFPWKVILGMGAAFIALKNPDDRRIASHSKR